MRSRSGIFCHGSFRRHAQKVMRRALARPDAELRKQKVCENTAPVGCAWFLLLVKRGKNNGWAGPGACWCPRARSATPTDRLLMIGSTCELFLLVSPHPNFSAQQDLSVHATHGRTVSFTPCGKAYRRHTGPELHTAGGMRGSRQGSVTRVSKQRAHSVGSAAAAAVTRVLSSTISSTMCAASSARPRCTRGHRGSRAPRPPREWRARWRPWRS